MWPFRRKRRRFIYANPQQRRETEVAILRARSRREDKVCAIFGPECEEVYSCWDWPRHGVALKVTYTDGYIEHVLIGDERVAQVAALR